MEPPTQNKSSLFPPYLIVDKIKTGEQPLAPLVPVYKEVFDGILSKTVNSLDKYSYGMNSLQEAIKNKKTYRQQTRIPRWVYAILDYLGFGAVGRAEKELHRVIKEVFDQAMKNSDLKGGIHQFLQPIQASYLQNYKDHPLLQEVGKFKEVQTLLYQKNILTPDFNTLLISGNPEDKEEFKRVLLVALDGDYDQIAKYQTISDCPGKEKFNLLQLTLHHKAFDLTEWLVNEILPKCKAEVQKSLMTQKGDQSLKHNDVVLMAAHCLGTNVEFPWIQWNRNIAIGMVRNKEFPLLGKLIGLYNELAYPESMEAEKKIPELVYCYGYRRNWPYPEDRAKFSEAMIKNT